MMYRFDQVLSVLDITLQPAHHDACQQLLHEAMLQQRHDQAAHMVGSLYPAAIAGQFLASLHQGNLLSAERMPQLQQTETEILTVFCELLGFAEGHFTHGGSQANLEALWLAKQRTPTRRKVYADENCHFSVHKACQMLDLQLHCLPSHDALLKHCQQEAPLAIIMTAGNTIDGRLDPFTDVAGIADTLQSWLHIDAAWGGFLALLADETLRAVSAGADSLCFDPHKSLGQPRPCGMLFYRQPLPAFNGPADYLASQPDSRLTGSRGAEHFLPLWLTWQHHGAKRVKQDLQHKLTTANQVSDWLIDKVQQLQCSVTGIVTFKHAADLQPLVDDGVISVVRRPDAPLYRLVFADRNCQAQAVIDRLVDYI